MAITPGIVDREIPPASMPIIPAMPTEKGIGIRREARTTKEAMKTPMRYIRLSPLRRNIPSGPCRLCSG